METSISLSAVLLTSILGFIATKGTLATAIGETVWEERDLTSTDGHGGLVTETSVATEPSAAVITPDDLHSTTIPATTTVVINATEIRLVNGSHPSEGRLEISINGVWGTICDDNFDVYDAKVACSMLGYTGITPQVKSYAYFGPGGGPIFLDSMACVGNETNILECQHSPIGVHDCSHSEDVGIVCRDVPDMRLMNGNSFGEGRVEININGTWGTVCDDDFDVNDATVVCRILGITGVTPQVRVAAYFGIGTGPIYLDDMGCSGTETDLLLCPHPPVGVHNCGHNEDVGVVCRPVTTTTPGPTRSSVRLVNGTQVSNGRLEILINGVWGTICDDSFDVSDATVACRMLGYTGVTPEVRGSVFYGPGTGQILLDDLACTGSETDLLACQHPLIGVHNCGHNEDVGINCRPERTRSSVRLVNGTHLSDGRLEIFISGVWGTICDDSFDLSDAIVACRMLGFTGGTPEVRSSASYGPGTGPILLDDVACTGSETNLLACQHPPIGVHNCGHIEDVGIICRPESTRSSVRLVNGTYFSDGRLEIFINGVWGTICDDSFDVRDATVACRMLGIAGATPEVRGSAFYGPGTGQILLDDVECSGSETDLLACQHPPIGVHNCGHNEDVGVSCRPVTTPTPGPTRSRVRLVNGTHLSDGRLEIFTNGVWGTICDDAFDVRDAIVACRMLGLSGATPEVRDSAFYGPGTGQILLDDLACTGSEIDLLACQHPPIGVHNCGHNEDVGIICRPGPTTSRVRLVNGTHFSDGRLEIFINGSWGTICDDSFDVSDATVACRMLGFEGVTPEVRGSAIYGPGTGQILLDDVSCTGSETDLLACQHPPIGVHNCGHNEDVGVSCRPVTTPTPGPTRSRVRLVNGTHLSDGRLEIFTNGVWGTICDDAFDVRDAIVACRMLGLSGATPEVRDSAFYGPGTGQILLDDLACTGSEIDLLACQHPPIGVHNCGHNEDVGIICRPGPTTSRVRLVNGTHFSDGRLEIFINGSWGTICDDSFDVSDATVACRMLGFEGVTPEVRGSAIYGPGTGQILLDDVSCTGSETDLLACQHPPIGVHNCGHNEDVGIICRPVNTTTTGPTRSRVRLVNGTHLSEGRLEIFTNGVWGTICDDAFDVRDAIVACRMLGLSGATPEVRDSAFYGPGTGQILLDDVECSGSETDLLACQHPPIGVHNCGHTEDVGIICRPV